MPCRTPPPRSGRIIPRYLPWQQAIDGTRVPKLLKGHARDGPYFSWGTKANRYTTDGTMASTGELDSHSLVVEPDGSFEIILSQKKQGKNWLPIAADIDRTAGPLEGAGPVEGNSRDGHDRADRRPEKAETADGQTAGREGLEKTNEVRLRNFARRLRRPVSTIFKPET